MDKLSHTIHGVESVKYKTFNAEFNDMCKLVGLKDKLYKPDELKREFLKLNV